MPNVAPFRDLGAYAWQTAAVVALALAFGFAAASDTRAALALFGLAAALALGMSFAHRRFDTLIAAWLFFLLQPLLVAVVGPGSAPGRLVNGADIPILLVIGLLGFFLAARHHARAVRWLAIAASVILACGFASDLAAGAPLTASVIGATYRMKFFLALGAALAVGWTPDLAARARKVVVVSATIVGVTGIFDFLSGGVLRSFFAAPTAQTHRLGYVAAGGIFQNLTALNAFMVIAFTVVLGMTWQRNPGRRVLQLFLLALGALLTLRLKAILSIPAAAAALAVTGRRARSRLVLITGLAALALAAFIALTQRDLVTEVVNEQVPKYTKETPQPRERLLTVSTEIARDDFPLGVGFGRFGSAPSIERGSYSPVYAQYGLAKYYGFGPRNPVSYALDTNWPGLLGEVGALGLLAFAATVSMLALLLFRRSREDGVQANFASIGFGVLVVLLVQSLGGGTFFESFTMLTAVLFIAPGLWLASDRARLTRPHDAGEQPISLSSRPGPEG